MYDLNWTEADNVSMIASQSTTVGGYVGGRGIGSGTISSGLTTVLRSGWVVGETIGVGFVGVVAGGNLLSASEMYGSNLSGSQFMNSAIYGR